MGMGSFFSEVEVICGAILRFPPSCPKIAELYRYFRDRPPQKRGQFAPKKARNLRIIGFRALLPLFFIVQVSGRLFQFGISKGEPGAQSRCGERLLPLQQEHRPLAEQRFEHCGRQREPKRAPVDAA
ncbi:hypothetical protein PAMA110636_09320 [Paenibacillus macerans]